MNRGKRLAVISGLILVGLLLYAAFPLAARADTSNPPPPTDVTVSPTPGADGSGGPNATEATNVAIQPIDNGTPAPPGSGGSSSSSTTNVVPLDSAGNPVGQATAVVNVPAGTSVVALDSSGNPVPLATQAAAGIISNGDPIWCPAGVAPSAGVGGCSSSFSSLANLISTIPTQPVSNGTIWIANGTDTSVGTITFNGSTLSQWATHSLTFQGGWDGTSAGTIVGATTFNANLNVTGWHNDISLNDLIFNGAGVYVDTAGNVHVHDLEVKNAPGYGLQITNLSGLTKTVDVSDGNFHNNGLSGLDITSNSTVTLSNVQASFNGLRGANILTNGSVSIDQGIFSTNNSDGLDVSSGGNIDVSHVTSDLNNGVTYNHAGTWLMTTHGDVSIDSSEFSGNQRDGLQAIASGSVNLTDVQAQENGFTNYNFAGTYLQAGSSGDVSINNGIFSNNYFDGLWAQAGGSIDLSNVTADNNDRTGRNHAGTFLQAGSAGNVSINSSAFSNNHWDGLWAQAGGSVSLSNVAANLNDSSGSHDHAGTFLQSGANSNISVDTSTFNNNAWDGLQALAGRSILFINSEANGNGTSGFNHAGAYLASGPSGDIQVNGGTFSGNQYGGLVANAGGMIDLVSVAANGNGLSGTSGMGASLAANGNVSITGGASGSSFSNNKFDGLQVTSSGSIAMANVTANSNDATGFLKGGTYLQSGVTGSISIDNSSFSGNYRDGLTATAGGPLTLNYVTANGNNINGQVAGGTAGTNLASNGNIAMNSSNFNNNYFDALHASAPGGRIDATGLIVQQNNITNFDVAAASLVAGTGMSISGSYSQNRYDGLHASTSAGNMTLSYFTGDHNQIAGSSFAGTYLVATGGSITIDKPAEFNHNTGVGLWAKAAGPIVLNEVTADFNGLDGVKLNSGNDASSKCGDYSQNGEYGINATLPGTLKLYGDILNGNVTGPTNVSGGGAVSFGGSCAPKEQPKKPVDATSVFVPSPAPAPTQAAALTLNVVNISEGQSLTLDCGSFLGTTLVLPNRDQVVISCPITGTATLKHLTSDTLPSPLATGMTYLSSMDAQVSQGGQPGGTLNGPMKVDFTIPSGQTDTTKLALLHWDGTQWVDLGGTATGTGYIESVTNQTGVFALVSR